MWILKNQWIYLKQKRIDHLIIYGTIIIFLAIYNNFSVLLSCKIHAFHTFNTVDFFQIVISRSTTEILILWNFWRAVYP